MPLQPGPLPKHYQLAEILRRKIAAGELKPGDRLPAENELCRQYQVSRGTVRKALNTLFHEGRVYSEQGRGTFVASKSVEPVFMTLAGFDAEMQKQHHQPKTRLLALEVIPASPRVAEKLAISAGDLVIHIDRLRMVDERPIVFETRYLAQSLCPWLPGDDLEHESIHSLLVKKYKIPLVRTVHTIEAQVLTPEQASLLQVQPGAPAFFIDRLTYTVDAQGERPAVWYQALYNGAEYTLRVEFERR